VATSGEPEETEAAAFGGARFVLDEGESPLSVISFFTARCKPPADTGQPSSSALRLPKMDFPCCFSSSSSVIGQGDDQHLCSKGWKSPPYVVTA
jgi:hypothetical protein